MANWKENVWFKGDRTLWYVIIGLMIASVVVVYSSTGRLAKGNPIFFLGKQVGIITVCFFLIYWLQSVHYKYFLGFAKAVLLLGIALLVVAKFAGTTLNSADRWIRIPWIGLTFQPSEIAKLGAVMYTARVLSFGQTERGCGDEVLRRMLYVVAAIGLIFLDNFSTSVLLGAVCLIMLFIGRVRTTRMLTILTGVVGVVALVVALSFTPKVGEMWRLPTIKSRVTAFFSGGEEESYQADQAKIAVAKGGLIGTGPGNSVQRNFLPHPYSDFIFAIIVEEYGLVGGGVILLLFLIILYRVGVIVRRCTRTFPALLAAGLGILIVLQALINMGVCVGFFPVTGQPLPLVSMGGTSLLFTSMAFGMILSVARTFDEEGEQAEEAGTEAVGTVEEEEVVEIQ